MQYFGVVAPAPSAPLVNGDPGRTNEQLAYKIVRTSVVTAQLVGPDGVAHPLESAAPHDPGTYTFSATTFDHEGLWHWTVTATDDLGRVSTVDRTFRYDTTLRGVRVTGRATVAFALSRPALVRVQIETKNGLVVARLPDAHRDAGSWTATWNGVVAGRVRAYSGTYVAHVFATSDVGTSDIAVPFTFRRG